MSSLIVLLLLIPTHFAIDHASREEEGTSAIVPMHPRPTHRVHMTHFPDHTELYEESPSGGIAAYITPDLVQVTSLHLEGHPPRDGVEGAHGEKGSDGIEEVGVNVARTAVILPLTRRKGNEW